MIFQNFIHNLQRFAKLPFINSCKYFNCNVNLRELKMLNTRHRQFGSFNCEEYFKAEQAKKAAEAKKKQKRRPRTIRSLFQFFCHPLTRERNTGYFNLIIGMVLYAAFFCKKCEDDKSNKSLNNTKNKNKKQNKKNLKAKHL